MKKRLMKCTALLLVFALAVSALSGCITTTAITALAITRKITDDRDKDDRDSRKQESKEARDKDSRKDTSDKDKSDKDTSDKDTSDKDGSGQSGSDTSENKKTIQDFREFTERVFVYLYGADTLSRHYHVYDPEKYGFDTSEVSWGSFEFSEETVEQYKSELDAYTEELQSFDYNELDWEGKLTYDCLSRYLELEYEGLGLDLLYEPLGPNAGIQAMLPLELAEYNFYRESDVEEYIALLELVPEYYGQIAAFERQRAEKGYFMEDDILDNTLSQIDDFLAAKEDSFLLSTFEERLSGLDLDPETEEEYIRRNREAVMESFYPSYELLRIELEKLRGSNQYAGGLCNYPDGKKYYDYLLRATVGSDMSPDQMIKKVDRAIDDGINTLRMLMSSNPGLYGLYDSTPYPTTDPNLCLRILQEKILKDFPEIPEVDYTVSYVDASLRDYLSPACYMLPPVDGDTTNSILINCERGEEEEDIFITLAHEGYPGHLYQFNYFKNNATYVLRDALGTSGFAEGYATYVENNSYSYIDGLEEDEAEFLRVNEQISLYIYTRVDLGIHWEGWTVDEVEDYIDDYFNGAHDAAVWMYDYMRADPGTYELYAIGELEILDMENEARNADDFDLKEFHKALLDCSEAPFAVIRENILQ